MPPSCSLHPGAEGRAQAPEVPRRPAHGRCSAATRPARRLCGHSWRKSRHSDTACAAGGAASDGQPTSSSSSFEPWQAEKLIRSQQGNARDAPYDIKQTRVSRPAPLVPCQRQHRRAGERTTRPQPASRAHSGPKAASAPVPFPCTAHCGDCHAGGGGGAGLHAVHAAQGERCIAQRGAVPWGRYSMMTLRKALPYPSALIRPYTHTN